MTIRIRAVDPFEDDDAEEAIRSLHAECLPGVELPELGDGFWWLAFRGREPVGYAGLHPSRRFCNVGYLCAAGVAPTARGHGLQRRLIRVREAKAKSLGWSWLITDTVPSNPASSNNLIRCGYLTFAPERPWRVEGAIFWRKQL